MCGAKMDTIKKLEIELHQYQTRQDKTRVEQLIHSDFLEIGYSGKVYSKQEIMNSLAEEPEPDYRVHSQDYEYIELAPDLMQVMYKAAHSYNDGTFSRHSIRTSIWQKVDGRWQIRFHQATAVANFQ